MESLLHMLPEMIRLSGDNEEVREQAAFAAWKAATGYQLSKGCVPIKLNEQTLVVATRDKIWKSQMERDAAGWVYKVNSVIGAAWVRFIEFRIDRRSVERAQPPAPPEHDAKEESEIREYLAPAAEKIQDPGLREAFLRAASKSLSHQHKK
jgi:hypothetical protein